MGTENKTQMKVLWSALLAAALVVALAWFAVKTSSIITYFLVAGALAYILNPAVEAMCRRRIPRGLAILIMFLIFAGAVAVGLSLIVPPVVRQFTELAENLPGWFDKLKGLWNTVLGLAREKELPVELGKLPEHVAAELQVVVKNAGVSVAGGISSFFSGLAALVIIPILVYYFLKDGAGMKANLLHLVPAPHRGETGELLGKINRALGGFVRGQLKLCLVMGVLTWLSLALIGLKYSVIFGAVAGVTEFIPYLGPILALIGPLIYATTVSWTKVGAVLVLFVIIQLLEGNVLAPRIIGKDVNMHPATILFALMAGGQVGGIAGMIAAIPAAVVIKVFFDHFYVGKVINRLDEKAGEEKSPE